jgi:RNA polymerase subunit RPABC4/transcription elongation factor Spt4
MEQRFYHGEFTPDDLAACLLVHFNRGNFVVRQFGSGDTVIVQIQTREDSLSGGQTALGVTLQKVDDGVSAQVGKQTLIGVAASLGFSALAALRNPMNLLSRIDDIAQDLESLQLSDEVWKVLDANARAKGSGFELSRRLHRIACEYCQTANPAGEPSCLACGAPLGNAQPTTCKNCGYVVFRSESICPNCKHPLTPSS